ncbi:MAG TPA: thymidylate synthase [Methanothermococcus okinawensis]|uniref:Thymidylate synthase n=1 Tax=Methanothermococcus okinawensis TaxID=155863 RepID=A0A833EAQ1_9EURY|nr:thymidylate synthase [Methanothermococcus okinawensis]
MRLTFLYHEGNQGMERFYHHLINDRDFCRICEDCYNCRGEWSYREEVERVVIPPVGKEEFIEDPSEYIPEIPRGDVVIAQLHQDLLYELPYIIEDRGYRLLIVPSETPKDLSPSMRNTLREICEELGMDFENPKPFCALKKREGREILNRFIDYFKIGYPQMEVKVEGHKVVDAKVLVSAPCGMTYYIAKRIRGKSLGELKEEVIKAHHNYPCLGSMEYDRELEDTILHEAGYIALESVRRALLPYRCKNRYCSKGCLMQP